MKNPRFLDLADILEIHQSRITLYGGTNEIRDLGILQSALAACLIFLDFNGISIDSDPL